MATTTTTTTTAIPRKSGKKDMKAFVRYDGRGVAVPSSLILTRKMPKVGKWIEVDAYKCCQPTIPITTTTTTTTARATTTTTTTNVPVTTTTTTTNVPVTTTTTTTNVPVTTTTTTTASIYYYNVQKYISADAFCTAGSIVDVTSSAPAIIGKFYDSLEVAGEVIEVLATAVSGGVNYTTTFEGTYRDNCVP